MDVSSSIACRRIEEKLRASSDEETLTEQTSEEINHEASQIIQRKRKLRHPPLEKPPPLKRIRNDSIPKGKTSLEENIDY